MPVWPHLKSQKLTLWISVNLKRVAHRQGSLALIIVIAATTIAVTDLESKYVELVSLALKAFMKLQRLQAGAKTAHLADNHAQTIVIVVTITATTNMELESVAKHWSLSRQRQDAENAHPLVSHAKKQKSVAIITAIWILSEFVGLV